MTMTITPEIAVGADVLTRDFMAVRRGESVLITVDTATDPLAGQAVMNAAAVLGAKPMLLVVPQLPYQGALADPYVGAPLAAAAVSADVWIDLTFPYLAGSHVHDEAMKTKKVRYLLGGDMGAGGIARLFGKVDLDRHYAVQKAFDEIVHGAVGRTVRITNEAGSDVSFALAKPGFIKPRRADGPGMYLVPGACTMFPELETVRGTINVAAAFHEYYTPLRTPLAFDVAGRIRTVDGGGGERPIMERALRRAAGGEYGYVIHFTHGIHPAARVTGKSFIEDMRATGNDAVGFGIPWWLPGGGENHPDCVLTMQSVWIDGIQVADRGRIVGPDRLARLSEELVPLAA
ncbi:MAG: hypothetical protein IT561_06030 [Alphaproteobacteria bacterium]|nr:hypothetical protein [Alphaproteobacteria bacterium]